jgi:dTMP kinase
MVFSSVADEFIHAVYSPRFLASAASPAASADQIINQMFERQQEAASQTPELKAPGLLVVLEGVDGSGKSTEAQLLVRWLARALQKPCHFIKFPIYNSPSGQVITQYLNGELGDLDPVSTACLYALNRREAKAEIDFQLSVGNTVLCDRYIYSNTAFQCARLDEIKARTDLHLMIEAIEFEKNGLPRADVVIQLDIPPEESERRAQARGKPDRHEADRRYQKAVAKEYSVLSFHHHESWLEIPVYDGHWSSPRFLSQAEVHAKVVERLQQHPAVRPRLAEVEVF